jgi:hypothetical protein
MSQLYSVYKRDDVVELDSNAQEFKPVLLGSLTGPYVESRLLEPTSASMAMNWRPKPSRKLSLIDRLIIVLICLLV